MEETKEMKERGCIQIYTGEGKGKTTAAFGLALRAAGRDKSVTIMQFLKAKASGEVLSVDKWLPHITVYRFSTQDLFLWEMDAEQLDYAKRELAIGLNMIRKVFESGTCGLLILDEILPSIRHGLVEESVILEILDSKPEEIEIVLTGRDASEKLIKRADLVTEMKAVKHPFEKGIEARRGIEY